MFPRLALAALLALPLAACDSEAMTDLRRNLGGAPEAEPAAPEGPRPPAVSPLVQPIETGTGTPQPVATAEPLTARSEAFIARGNEPFWNVQLAGSSAVYRTPENQAGRSIAVNRLVFAGGVEYIGVLNGRPFVVNLRPAPCQDDMSGERFPLTARLTINGETRNGCAEPGSVRPPQAAGTPAAPATSG